MHIKIGADPELFIKDKSGRYISAHGVIPGTKAHPHVVDKGAVQVDGMALEFNIDPADTLEEFKENVTTVMGILAGMLPEEWSLDAVPTAHFDPKYMAEQPPEALELGCEPDYNAYTGEANEPPNGDVNFRTGAGHIHIGWTENEDITNPEHLDACRMLVKQLDVILGIPSTIWDDDTERRSLYGKAGAFRPKPYGVEYRVLSNKWLTSPDIMDYVYEAVHKGFNDLMSGMAYYDTITPLGAIDGGDKDDARYCLDNYTRLFMGKDLKFFEGLGKKKEAEVVLSKLGVRKYEHKVSLKYTPMGSFFQEKMGYYKA